MANIWVRPLRWIARRSLRERMGASLALMVFLVAGLLGGVLGATSENEARDRIGQSLAVDAQRLAERLTTEMESRSRELTLLAGIDAFQSLPGTARVAPGMGLAAGLTPALARTQSLLDDLHNSVKAYLWIALADATGHVLAATDPSSIGTDISAREAAADGLRRTGAVSDTSDDRRAIALLQPVRDADGVVVGVIAAQLSWDWVRGIEHSVITPDADGSVRRETFLIGGDNTVLLGPDGFVGRTLSLDAAARARAGFYGWSVEHWPGNSLEPSGGPFLTGVAFAARTGPSPAPASQPMRWSVLVREAEHSAFAPATALRRTIWEAGLGVALVFAAAGWLLAGIATAPLARIAIAAERLRQGDDVEIPRIRGPAEIESLSVSLRALVASLTRKQQALDEMEELALRDPLTGLLNRHGMRVGLEAALSEAYAHDSSLMLFVGDLDGFKSVNDTLGHATGDLLLCHVARRLLQSVRAHDLVARIGGDEFLLALRAPAGAADESAILVAKRVQAAVGAPYQLGGRTVEVGCSLGGACWPDAAGRDATAPPSASELDRVIEQADAVLYRVKRSGKGRVELHGAMAVLKRP